MELYCHRGWMLTHFLFLTSLESPLNKGGSEGVWKYRWLQTFGVKVPYWVDSLEKCIANLKQDC